MHFTCNLFFSFKGTVYPVALKIDNLLNNRQNNQGQGKAIISTKWFGKNILLQFNVKGKARP